MSNIHLTKLAAARRQLCAAIRMYFAREDELAVHTVASAAYRIIADLKSNRGRDEAAEFYLRGIWAVVQDFRRGVLPGYFSEDPKEISRIRELAEKLPMITATTKFEDITGDVYPPDLKKQFWKGRTKVANFLKHADRDESDHISLDEVDNLFLLGLACSSYLDVDKDGLGIEGMVMGVFLSVTQGNAESLSEDLHGFSAYLEPLSHDERLKFCSNWLQEWNQREEAGE